MVTTTGGYSGMSVDDLDAALVFYRDTLGLDCSPTPNGLTLKTGDSTVFVYPKGDAHQPATYTAVYLDVADIDVAVDELTAAGVALEHYEGVHQDEKGIARGKASGHGPDIAWFLDPARNIVAVLNG
jgi:catechol 2,3-dioxygenase-like lactoylglutathione lyase family enzyme